MKAEPSTAISSQTNIRETIFPISDVPPQNNSEEPKETGIPNVELTDQTNLLPFRKVLVVFLSLACCLVVSALDSTIVATALPTISAVFQAGSVSSWVPAATLLTSTAFQPLYGRFSDIFGRKAMLIVAMGLFMIGSLAAGLSRNIDELIVFRAISGAGAGGIITMAQVVMSDVVSLRDRGKYQGIIGGFVALGYAIGPLIGGALAEKVSWRWCFWITLPISATAILVVAFVLPLKSVTGNIKHKLLLIDYLGTVLTLGGCTLILLPLTWGGVTFSWTSGNVLGTLLGGVGILTVFIVWEMKGAKLPIVPMHIFRHSTVCGVYITMFINGFIFWASSFYLPQFFQVALGYSPIHSGVFILPVLVSQTVASLISGIIVSRTGRYRTIVYCGFSVMAIGSGCLATLNETKPKSELVIFMLLSGIGAGQTLQTTTVAAQASVSRKDMSVVTAVRNLVRYVGGALALAVGSSIINNALISRAHSIGFPEDQLQQLTDNPTLISKTTFNVTAEVRRELLEGYIHGFHIMFTLNASLAAFAVVVAIIMIKHKELTRADDAQLKAEARKRADFEMKAARTKEASEDSRKLATARNDSANGGETVSRRPATMSSF